ncbi:integrase [Streptomyces rubiginosohelvolus]|uniref:integrase n=1 Tax=Streptomyces rubiginosohelvolus TaxID=67362 RepID=UPI0036B72934
MTSLAIEKDPYILELPGPDSPVVLDQWISPGNTHPNARYCDAAWPLGPLIDNPGTSVRSINWTKCPPSSLSQLKLTAWTMINGQLRPTYLKSRGVRARARASAFEFQETCSEWMRLALWLHKRHISDLSGCTDDVWRAYVAERWRDGLSRRSAERVCARLTDLWAFDQLSARPSCIAQPPWESEGIDDFLPAADGSAAGENSTEPLDPQVLGPLLVWAIRFVDDFADDILAAWAERCRLAALAEGNKATPASLTALREFLLPMARSGGPLPSTWNQGQPTMARTYVAAVTGASLGQVDRLTQSHQLSALVAERPGPCPLHVSVTGRIDGKPWREDVDFDEAAELMRHLGTASAIICLYLTGMRPQEVQGLRSGCCPDPVVKEDGSADRYLIRTAADSATAAGQPDPEADLHLIRGRHYKNVTDDDGNHVSAGEERTVPWVAITPVVNAIRVLERMVPPGELLLSSAHHDFTYRRGHHGALKIQSLRQRIESFVAWANHEAQVRGLPEQVIADDPHGPIGLARFRRTLAWHIARRPGGLIALAIQYGHMRTILDARVSSGYGSRSRAGMHSVLDVETALAAAETAAKLRDRAAAGEKISGPAAQRALVAAAETPRFEGKLVTTTFARKATKFLERDGVVLFDNPEAMLICAFKRDTALCEPAPGANAPRQYDCRPGCGNAVRTDSHARSLRIRADEIDQLAAAAPGPVGRRLHANADRLREIADTHDATAQTAKAIA